MKFKLRKITGVNGTEVRISVLFSPEETTEGLLSVRDDENVHLDLLRADGDDFLKADHGLMVLRSLCHYASLWSMRNNRLISLHVSRGVLMREAREKAPRRKKRRPRR